MIKLNEVLSKKIPKDSNNSIIYFLIKEDRIVYVGKSKNGISRILTHIKSNDKDFDSYHYIQVDKIEFDFLESEYIREFNPYYNILLKNPIPNHIKSIPMF